ncbi:MAG: hypothetical protein GC160_22685 [Acidobacteria bacterium]|nr:hypothetical protein [Acidobacteriota bacterium]
MLTPGEKALCEGAARLELCDRARLEAFGEDRVRLLHALATMPIADLDPGEGTQTFFLSPQGRIQAFCRLYVMEDRVLLETDPRRRAALQSYLDGYVIMDDVTLEDRTAATAAIAVEGPGARETIARALDGLAPPAEPHAHAADGPWRVFASSLSGQDGGWIMTEAERKAELLERLDRAGASPASASDLLRVRVSNRIPSFDEDYFDTNIPHETQQLQWVSFNKGCYVGQEIVERVRSLGQVNKLLVPLEVEGAAELTNAEVLFDGRPTGTLTSVVESLEGGARRGFAILRRVAVEAGTDLLVDGRTARILPWP